MEHDLRQPFIKSNALLNFDDAWTTIGSDSNADDLANIYRKVSYLFRAVDILSNAVSRMPFVIYKGKDIVDEYPSPEYKNVLGFLDNPGMTFGKIEAAIQMWGNAYQFRVSRGRYIERLRYILPSTIRLNIDEDTGEFTFTRIVNGRAKDYTTDEIIYYWRSDPFVEEGESKSSSVMAAAAAAGVLLSVDDFAAAFFDRGAIKAQLFSVAGNVPQPERAKFKSFLQRLFRGGQSSWASDVLNADVNVTEIGEGLESLDNRNLTDEQREAIATAMGIPHSLLFSNASNFAVSEQDYYNLYDLKIVPDCMFIQSVHNEQVLKPLGYRMEYQWQTLDVFQEDEKERSAAVQFYAQSFANYGRFSKPAMMALGVEMPPEAEEMLEALWAEQEAKEEQRRADFQARLQQAQAPPKKDEAAELKPSPKEVEKSTDLDKWRQYALKRVRAGKMPDRDWNIDGTDISGATKGAIFAALQDCETAEDVDAVFDDVWTGYP